MFSEEDDLNNDDEQIQLHNLCKSGTLGDVLKCLQSLKSMILWYYEGQTPIHAAVLSGRKDVCDVISALLKHGANINAQNITEGNTALHLAVLHGQFPRHYNTIEYLIHKKADVTIRNKTLRTPYDCAIATGQDELARVIDGSLTKEKAIELYKKRVANTFGPLVIEAVLTNQEKELIKCLDLGGDPNYVNKYRAGAIHYAVTHSNLPVHETLASLLQAGADPNLTNEELETALTLVIKSERLRENGTMERCVEVLVYGGAKSNIKNVDEKDALILAEERGYSGIVKILRKKKSSPVIDVNTPNVDGLYPIHVATLSKDPAHRLRKIDELAAKGADVNKQVESTSNTALHLCAENDYGEAAAALLDQRINYNLRNKQGKTAYDIARDKGSESVVAAIKKKQQTDNVHKSQNKSKCCVIL